MVFYLKGGSDGFVATSVGVRERPRGGGGGGIMCVCGGEKKLERSTTVSRM